MKMLLVVCLIFSSFGLTAIPSTNTFEFDLSRDFSLASNPNGVWTYGRKDAIGGTFSVLAASSTATANNGVPVVLWAISPSSQPAIYHNDTTETATSGGGGIYPPETTWFAPSVQGQPGNYAVARFTAPVDGTYRLVTSARPAYEDSVQLDTDFYVAWNNVEIFEAQLNGGQTAGYTNTIALATGDTIDFAVGRGADNSYIWSVLKVEVMFDVISTNASPPTILSQPQSQTIATGTSVIFSVGASGSAPLSYRWRKEGITISGATNTSLTFTNVQLSHAGNYTAVVSNAQGIAISDTAALTVIGLAGPALVVPKAAENTHTPFGSGTLRDASRYQQVYGSVEFPPQPIWIRELRFRPDATYGAAFTTVVANIQFNLSTSARNPSGLSSSFADNMGVDDTVVFQGPLSISSRFTGPAAGPKEFDIVVPLTQQFLYDPQRGNLVVDIRNFSGSGASLVGGQAGPDAAARVLGESASATSGNVDSGSDAIQVVYLPATNLPPTIITQPAPQAALEGRTVTFAVGASGTAPLSYHWRKDTTPISATTNATLTLTNLQLTQAGNYSVVASNAFGVAISQAAMLTVYAIPVHAAVVPKTAESVETPFGAGTLRIAGSRHQQVYGSVEFPQVPMVIEELRFRPDARFGEAFSTTVSNIQINLSTTQRNPGSLSSTFSQNVGANDTIVFQGPLSISSQFVGPTNGPKAFDIVVPLAQPFFYDPAGGNLVIDIRNFSGSTASSVNGHTEPDSASRVIGSIAAATGNVHFVADAIQIVFTPATNPQPRIIVQPRSLVGLEGSNVTFSVAAIGSAPLNYQWRFNGVPIAGATGPSLTVTNVALSDAGFYSVRVQNGAGIVSSVDAVLSVVTRAGLVIPAGLEAREGVGASGSLTEQQRLQQLYGGSQLPAGNLYITELRFRPSADHGTGAFSTTIDNIQVNLSTTLKQPNNLSLTFAENTGTNDTLVFSGPLSISSQFSGAEAGPKEFDISIPLQTPFLFNRAHGNLLVDIRNFSGAPLRYVVDNDNAIDQASRIVATSASATLAVAADDRADVIQIVYSTTNTAPRLATGVFIPSIAFTFNFDSGGVANYIVEASTNLANWTTLTNISGATGRLEIIDRAASSLPQRFYRARSTD